jgi:hypothetical protein
MNRELDLQRDREICLKQMVGMKLVLSDKEYIEKLEREIKALKEKLKQ